MSKLTLFLYRYELDSMDEYSSTLPSETTIGKVWKRCIGCWREPRKEAALVVEAAWVVGLYAYVIPPTLRELSRNHNHTGSVRILWFDVVVREGPEPPGWRAPDWSNFAAWQREYREARQLRSVA